MKVAACIAALSLATGALGGIEPPSSNGSAHLGSLRVTSVVSLSATNVELIGIWRDTELSCLANRKLRVHVVIEAWSSDRSVERNGVFKMANCAAPDEPEGVGFTLTARSLGLACPTGAWKPGRYTFLLQTTEPKRGLKATAFLPWVKPGRC
jgi:hypothetical protein